MNTGDYVGTDRDERLVDTGECPTGTCGNHVYVVQRQYKRLRESGDTFYCPAGHAQSFTPEKEIDAREKRAKEAEARAEKAEQQRQRAQREANLAARTCPWPTCEGRALSSPRGLRQHLVRTHGAPWATAELSADDVVQVLNGRDPVDVVR